MSKRYNVPISELELEVVLDVLATQMTEAKWRKDPKRAENIYATYQTFGQALGEKDITLSFTEQKDNHG